MFMANPCCFPTFFPRISIFIYPFPMWFYLKKNISNPSAHHILGHPGRWKRSQGVELPSLGGLLRSLPSGGVELWLPIFPMFGGQLELRIEWAPTT